MCCFFQKDHSPGWTPALLHIFLVILVIALPWFLQGPAAALVADQVVRLVALASPAHFEECKKPKFKLPRIVLKPLVCLPDSYEPSGPCWADTRGGKQTTSQQQRIRTVCAPFSPLRFLRCPREPFQQTLVFTVRQACVHCCDALHGISYHADGTGKQAIGRLTYRWCNSVKASKRHARTEKVLERISPMVPRRRCSCAQRTSGLGGVGALQELPRVGRYGGLQGVAEQQQVGVVGLVPQHHLHSGRRGHCQQHPDVRPAQAGGEYVVVGLALMA